MPEPDSRSGLTTSSLRAAVEDRFGVLPNFFCLGGDAPEITANLWGFAQFGYLDNPLPSCSRRDSSSTCPVSATCVTVSPGTSASWLASGTPRAIVHVLRTPSNERYG
jgi:hypothetical protein